MALIYLLFTGLVAMAIIVDKPIPAMISCFILVLMAFMYLNFDRLQSAVTVDEVTFGFGLFTKTFSRSKILSCEPYQLRFKNFLGYGIRPGFDGTIAYNTRNGRGIKITVEGKKKPYVMTVDNPERACQAIRSPAD